MALAEDDTDELVRRAGDGDVQATEKLMERHRARLRQMVAVRMDPRLAARVDPSDVVQETLAEALRKLPDYVRDRPLPFYPWLRQVAWDRLVELHQRHVRAQKRSVTREEQGIPDLSDQSVWELARQFVSSETSPSARLVRQELHQRAREALARLAPRDREVLVMRHLEQMPISEIAAVLGITEGSVKMRRLRAIERLRQLLGPASPEDFQ